MKTKQAPVINWATLPGELQLITSMAARAQTLAVAAGIEYSMRDAQMDLTATHANGCRLDLERMASADDFNFAHDVFGIRRHIDRETGTLTGCFVPRFAERY